ncbi:sensor histidine kinase|uniref:histidine kinase n=1 Tax=Dendrosporobacter quercicolus TaxID=146817 RepID=A0A1G9S112_9FIRM|nr:ATP-binding protein [Dendrosporobacter quercicolus]NSL49506.1 sensor histidine kinase [Dendrosporobacter quercicolus DSM 1736]SDM28940.1 two-component system, NarL family, nitrate/nitrite sensor histidine kinase NarX [Dendrosporobacter quercicolus]
MNITRMKWLAALVPAICIGLFEFARHEFLHVVSMEWGNVLVAALTGLLFVLFSHGIFALMENLYGKLQQEKRETAVLQERYRIARNLHDSIAQALFFMNVKTIEIAAACQNRQELLPAIKELQEAIKLTDTEIRQHIFSLQAVTQPNDNFDLAAAIQVHLQQYEAQTGATTKLTKNCSSLAKFSPYERRQLFHIFQELLFNIRKHAEATQVSISLKENDQGFSMEIADNGKGFAAENLQQKKSSFGYKILEQDIQSIGADLKLTSVPGTGTTVTVLLQDSRSEVIV